MERVRQLERSLKVKEDETEDVVKKVGLMEQNDQVTRNELNFWNGKVTNMKRDLDFQQTFNQRLTDENKKLSSDVENLKKHLELKDKELALSVRQV